MYSKLMFGAAAILTAGTLVAAQTTTFNKAADWRNGAVTEKNGVLTVQKTPMLYSAKAIKIDPKKTYRISFSAKADGLKGKDTAWVLGGFGLLDKSGKDIAEWNVAAVPNSMTELAKAAKKGDTFLLLKDLSKIKAVFGHYYVVYGAKKDFSDLPNRNLIGTPKSLTKEGNLYKLTLTRPLQIPLAAGTAIRLHIGGSYMYAAGAKYIGKDWVKFSGTVKGMFMNGGWSYSQWPRGTASVKVILLSNWNRKATAVQYKDLTVVEE